MFTKLSPQGQSALKLVGGLYKLAMATKEDLRWLKKKFVSAWKSTAANVRSLAPAGSMHGEPIDAVQSLASTRSITSTTSTNPG